MNASKNVLIRTLSAKTRKTQNTHPDLRGEGRAPLYGYHIIKQEVSEWGQARTLDPALGAPQHGKAADGTETRLTWRHTDDTLSAWPPDRHFLFLQLASFPTERILNTFSPRIITLTAFHKTASKNCPFPPPSYLFCVDLRENVQNWTSGRCLWWGKAETALKVGCF